MSAITDKIKKRPYQFFLLRLLVLLVILFALDYALGAVLRYYYFKQESGELYRITYSMEKTKEDILIIGSSRANHHFHPAVFEQNMHLTCYNTGRDGEHIFYHYAMVKSVLKRYTPKIMIFDFIAAEFAKDKASYDRISTLLPYYNSHPEIRSIIRLRGRYERFKLFSKLYPYNSVIFQVALGNTKYKKAKHEDINGYLPMTRTWDQPIKEFDYLEYYPIDSVKLKIFDSMIKECVQSGARVYVFCSPYFFNAKNQDYSIKLGEEIAKKYNVDFFDFSDNSYFTHHQELFNDFAHLNDSGAHVFSRMAIDTINKAYMSRMNHSALR